MISVDQLDTETSGLGVYHQRIADREPIERVTPRLLMPFMFSRTHSSLPVFASTATSDPLRPRP